MKHKTWFRLVLKLFGVYFVIEGMPSLISSLSGLFQILQQSSGMQMIGVSPSWYFLQVLSPVLQTGLGLYLFFGGEWVVNKAIPSNRPYCPECGYDLSGAVSSRCPECDTPFDPEQVRPSALASADADSADDTDAFTSQ